MRVFQFLNNIFKVKNAKYLIYILSFTFILSFQAQAQEVESADSEIVKEVTPAERKLKK